MEPAATLEVYSARATLYLAIAVILDVERSAVELAALRVTLAASEPPAALALAWETVRQLVGRMERAPSDVPAPVWARGNARQWSRDLRALALCTDARREALLRGETSGGDELGRRCGRAETGAAARRLVAAAEELGQQTEGFYVSIGRALGWILRDDPHLTEIGAQEPRGAEHATIDR